MHFQNGTNEDNKRVYISVFTPLWFYLCKVLCANAIPVQSLTDWTGGDKPEASNASLTVNQEVVGTIVEWCVNTLSQSIRCFSVLSILPNTALMKQTELYLDSGRLRLQRLNQNETVSLDYGGFPLYPQPVFNLWSLPYSLFFWKSDSSLVHNKLVG